MRSFILIGLIVAPLCAWQMSELATGQTTVYQSGDDGTYQAGMRRSFTRDAAKEIVTDHLTSLVWQDSSVNATSLYTLNEANNACNVLTLGGWSDWRLPTIEELRSLVDKGTASSAKMSNAFLHVSDDDHWSATPYDLFAIQSWSIDFFTGGDGVNAQGDRLNVRCVRGSVQTPASFSRDGTNNVVTDSTTGLIWQDDADAKNLEHNWSAAISYCEHLTLAGRTDWRLPSVNELWGLSDRSKSGPALPVAFVNYDNTNSYWSSTVNVNELNTSWDVNVYDGNGFKKNWVEQNSVRCVRGRYVHPAEPYIERFFQSFYGDSADRDDFYQWYEVMKQQSAASVAIAFFNSQEFKNMNLTDAQYLDLLYTTVMGRALTQTEKNAFLARLGSGVSRETIFFELLRSQEFSTYASDMGVVAITIAELPKASVSPSILMYLLQ